MGTYYGRGLVCDPEMPADQQTVYGFSNETTRILHVEADPLEQLVLPMFLCGDVDSRICHGRVESTYKRHDLYGPMCNEKCPICIPYEATPPPTQVPTTSTTGTAHGDPIIWTFNDECYDLNKDGPYDAPV